MSVFEGNHNSILRIRDITLLTKVHIVKAVVFPVQTRELDHKNGWVKRKWCFWTVGLEKTLESPLDSKEIKPVTPKGNHTEYSLEGLMLKLKLQYYSHKMQRADWERPWCWERQEGMADDEMFEWHYGRESEKTPGDGKGQGSLACYSWWSLKELDMTEQLNNKK